MIGNQSVSLAAKRDRRIHAHCPRRRQKTCHQADHSEEHGGSDKRQWIECRDTKKQAGKQPSHSNCCAYSCCRTKEHDDESSTEK
jgi:hypothetical protein